MKCSNCSYEPTMSEMQKSPGVCGKCGVVYGGAAPAAEAQARPAKTTKRSGLLVWVIGAVLLGVACYGGWKIFQQRQAVAAIEVELRLATAHTRQIVTALDGAGGMSFAEFFQKAGAGVNEIDAAMVRVSVVRPVVDIAAPAESYMKAAQELIRGMSAVMRVNLDFSTAQARLDRAKEDASSRNSYTRERALDRQLEATNEMIALLKNIEDAQRRTRLAAVSLLEAGQAIEGVGDDALASRTLLYKFVEKSK